MAQAVNRSYPGIFGTKLYVGVNPPVEGALITTITLQNTSASTQAAGFVSPMFGLPLKQGDMPAGQYPQFKLTDGTNCPASIWGVSSWPDGSMKFCAAMVRVPSSVAGSGTLALQVYSGGTTPAPSARTTADLTAADLKVELTGVTNLTGLWTASLNTAIADADDIVVIGDGPAGKVWRIGGPCKQAGAAHGQLHAWHYVAALTNSSGGLLGLRYLGKVGQPWVDVASPAPARRVATAALKSGATNLRTLQGHDTTETPGANIGMPHYSSFFTVGAEGLWDFVAGSQATECTLRVIHNKTYFTKSRLVPSYDLSLAATSSTAHNYAPYGAGPMQRYMPGTGERDDIALLPTWMVRHLLTQSAAEERTVRTVGLSSGGWRTQLRHRAYPSGVIPCTTAAASYAGMGNVLPSIRYSDGGGVAMPADNTSLWVGETEPSHRPSAAYYPYLITGEPQYLDLLEDHAAELLLAWIPGSRTPRVTLPVTNTTLFANADYGERDAVVGATNYKGGGQFFVGGVVRVMAWSTRDIAQAAAILPDTSPSGVGTRAYLREVLEQSYAAINDYNTRFGADWQNTGILNFDERKEFLYSWASGYLSNSVCHQANILGSTSAATLRAYLGRYWEGIANQMDIACAFSYHGSMFDQNGVRATTTPELLYGLSAQLTFDSGTSRMTVSGTTGNWYSWSPSNGDVFAFLTAANPYPAIPEYQRMYAVNSSGKSCQLSLTPGGSPVAVPATMVITSCMAQIQDFSPDVSFEVNLGSGGYLANITSAIRSHAAGGDPMTASLAKSGINLATAGTVFTDNPKNAVVAQYPE